MVKKTGQSTRNRLARLAAFRRTDSPGGELFAVVAAGLLAGLMPSSSAGEEAIPVEAILA